MLTTGSSRRWIISTTRRLITATANATTTRKAKAKANATIGQYQGLQMQCRILEVSNMNRTDSNRWFSTNKDLPLSVDVGTRFHSLGVQDDEELDDERNRHKSKIRIDFQEFDDDDDCGDDDAPSRKPKSNNYDESIQRDGFTNKIELRMPSEAMGFPVGTYRYNSN
jgi:hypothetical protein